MRDARFVLAALLLAVTATQAQAGFITFSIAGDASDWPILGRAYNPGTISGVIYGLVDNLNGQTPTSIEFTSDVSAVGISNLLITPVSVIGGIDISGGQVQSTTSMIVNFVDPDPDFGARQLMLNYNLANVLIWNGGIAPPYNGMGNANGFSGATYSQLSDGTTVPEPTSLALAGIGLAISAFRRRRQQSRTA